MMKCHVMVALMNTLGLQWCSVVHVTSITVLTAMSTINAVDNCPIVGLDKESLKLLPSLIKPTDYLCSQPDHEIEVLKFYCEACQLLTCRNFTLFYHKDHRIDEMCNIAKVHRDVIKKTLVCAQKLATKLTIAIDDNYNNAEQISKLKQNIKLIIDLSFKQLDHTNEENKKRLLEAILLSKTTVLTLQKEQLVKIQDELGYYTEMISYILQTHTDQEIVALGHLVPTELR